VGPRSVETAPLEEVWTAGGSIKRRRSDGSSSSLLSRRPSTGRTTASCGTRRWTRAGSSWATK